MRFFKVLSIRDGQVAIDKQEKEHIFKVIRLKEGDIINLFDDKHTYECVIKKNDPFLVQVIKSSPISSEYVFHIRLFMAMIKKPNFEMVLEKAVELGVNEIIPTYFNYSQANLHYNFERLNKIIDASQKQSNHFNHIIIHNPIKFNDAIKMIHPDDFNCVAYEKAQDSSIAKLKINPKSKYINLFIGPEGGISTSEMELFYENHFKIVKLTKTILKAETAAIYLISNVIERIKDEKN